MRRAVFETERLVLRPLRKSDYQTWFNANVNAKPKQSPWDDGPRSAKTCTIRRFNYIVKKHRELAKKDDWYFWGLFEKGSNNLVGHVDFDIFARDERQFANFGYYLHNRFYGYGYGREAAAMALVIAFSSLKLNRIEAAINFRNRKSIRLARMIGMRRECVRRRYWFEHGKWVDHLIYVANPEDIHLKSNPPWRKK
jgi:RimJ/RimL family protein N-acetyltransferase